MRTTVSVEASLLKAVKKRAHNQSSTISEIVDDALRELLARPTRHERRDEKLRAWGKKKRSPRPGSGK